MALRYTQEGSYIGLRRFVDLLRTQQIQEDLDCLIGVSGFKGFGKSSFSGQVCRHYVPKYLKEKFVWEKYTPYTIDQVFEKLDTLPEYAPLNCDEAVNFAMGEDWMRRHMKDLKKIFARVRTKHHIFFFNIPDIWWLDRKYRENMMTMWIHCVKKGHVMFSLPNIAPGIEDRWYRKWLVKAFTHRPVNIFTPKEQIMKKLKKYPCYFDQFAFPKLPKRMYRKHLQLREKYVLMRGSEERDKRPVIIRNIVLATFFDYLKNNGQPKLTLMQFHEKYTSELMSFTTLKKAIERGRQATNRPQEFLLY